MTKLSDSNTHAQLANLRQHLFTQVRGQETVLLRLLDTIERRELDVIPQSGVRGAFLFAGPTGVGKTSCALALAQGLHLPCVRFDCSEFKSHAAYDKLFGVNGRLALAYSQAPSGVWLWDEIEKAHPELVHLFLQGLDAARLTLDSGQILDLTHSYFIVTTNLGSAALVGRENLPFTSLENHVCRAIERWMNPEIRARFEDPFVFRPLTRSTQLEIVQALLEQIIAYNQERGRLITFEPEVVPFLALRAYSARLGARPIRRSVETTVGNALKSNWLRRGHLIVDGDALRFISTP